MLGGPIFQHLAGVKAYFQPGNGVDAFNYAPLRTRFPSGMYQLYVIEWVALGRQWSWLADQTIWDGTEAGSGIADMLTTNSRAMILPAEAAGDFS